MWNGRVVGGTGRGPERALARTGAHDAPRVRYRRASGAASVLPTLQAFTATRPRRWSGGSLQGGRWPSTVNASRAAAAIRVVVGGSSSGGRDGNGSEGKGRGGSHVERSAAERSGGGAASGKGDTHNCNRQPVLCRYAPGLHCHAWLLRAHRLRELSDDKGGTKRLVRAAAGGFELLSARPGPRCGHAADASSYFDRLWQTGLSVHSAAHERFVHVRVKASREARPHLQQDAEDLARRGRGRSPTQLLPLPPTRGGGGGRRRRSRRRSRLKSRHLASVSQLPNLPRAGRTKALGDIALQQYARRCAWTCWTGPRAQFS